MTVARLSPPIGPIDATVVVPGSKSVANRALVCAMLADGESLLHGVPDGDDTRVIVDVLTQVGRAETDGGTVTIQGAPDGTLPGIIDARLAGTSSRFLTAVAALSAAATLIDGDDPLRRRPMADLHGALVDLGALVEPLGAPGHLPVSISGGAIAGGKITMRGDVSSQFISALMLIGPLLSGGLTIEVTGELVSASYVSMTARVMADFGVDVDVDTGSTRGRIVVPEGRYVARQYRVEPDFSSAAFPIAAVLIRGGRVRVKSLALGREQGDAAILGIATRLGATWAADGHDVVVELADTAIVESVEFSMSDCSDLVPAVAVAAGFRCRSTTISGVGFIRAKESDRLGDLAAELTKAHVPVRVDPDGLTISGPVECQGCVVATHHDHRLAMSLALLSLSGASIGVEDPEVVTKSWPSYFHDMVDILGPVSMEN